MFYKVKGGSAKVSVPVNRKSMGVSANHTEEARLVGRGARPGLFPWHRREQLAGGWAQDEPCPAPR